jgi:hypothetical protein
MAKPGRPKRNYEEMPARFPQGTFERIDGVRKPGETRIDFLRVAVEREVQVRLAETPPPPQSARKVD